MDSDKRFIFIVVCVIVVIVLLNYKRESFKGQPVFRMYYTKWCSWSKKALPEFRALGNQVITNSGQIIKIQLVDCQLNESLCNKAKIDGYPTLQLESSNGIIPYNGSRETDKILEFLKKQ